MRYSRQNKILELITTTSVETQEQLCQLLKDAGYDVTQATVSRDIKELQLIKTLSADGKYHYSQFKGNGFISERFVKIFRETITKITPAGNLIVVNTLSGCASAAGEAIDSVDFPHIVGSIAGDNTLLLVVDKENHVPAVMNAFDEMMK
ncbi:MAG: arginine repressor [Firmicutes bacterium]|nr:arginine repressor [Bacillota bacterium]MBQ3963828.1 arginine repressor [Bacillota bacterium]